MNIIGLDCQSTEIRGIVSDSTGSVLNTVRMAVNAEEGGMRYIQKVQSLLNTLAQTNDKIDKMGISTLGTVDTNSFIVIDGPSNMSGYIGTDYKAVVRSVFDTQLFVEKRARAALEGEHWIGAAKNYDNAALIMLDSDIEGAVMENGKLYTGKNFLAGSWDRMVTRNEEGKLCKSSDLISSKKLFDDMEQVFDVKMCGEEYMEECLKGNEQTTEILKTYSKNLFMVLQNIQACFDPAVILIAGELSEWYEIIMPYIKKLMKQHKTSINIKKSELGVEAGSIGAVRICLRDLA